MLPEEVKLIIGRVLTAVFIIGLLVTSIIYLNSRWARIRDIRRISDAQAVIKALDFYNVQVGEYPKNSADDGDGWDKTNDPNRNFLQPLSELGLISNLIFDPKNDENYYYRYQKFAAGKFGCQKPFAVFQVASFETDNENIGNGSCPQINWTTLAPYGFTWFSLE